MKIIELIAELERQLAAGEISDEDVERLQELRRQLNDGFDAVGQADGQRMADDDHQDDDGADRMADDDKGDDDDGARAAADGNADPDDAQRAADDSNADPDDGGQRSVDDGNVDPDDAPRAQTRAARRQAARAASKISGASMGQHFRQAAAGRRSLPDANPEGGRSLDQVSIHPHGRVPKHDELQHLDLGNYVRALWNPGAFHVEAKRELAWMERNLDQGFQVSNNGGSYVPFALLADHGPNAQRRAAERELKGVSPEQHLESFMPLAEQTYRHLHEHREGYGYGERTLTQVATSAGAATGTVVDIARSIMWLTEMDSALEMLTVLPGLQGQWQGFFGNANPAEDWVAEGADLTETTPTLTRLQRMPKTLGLFWTISTAQLSSADHPIASMIEAGCEQVFRTKWMRAVLSGNDVGASFANDANAIDGLTNSGITETGFGAALTNLDRADIVDAHTRLLASEVDPSELGWILDNAAAGQLEKTLRGGSATGEYVFADNMVNTNAQSYPGRRTVHLGKTSENDVMALVQRSAAVALIWGAGLLFNALQIPGETKTRYDLQIQGNFAMMNPKRATVLKRG